MNLNYSINGISFSSLGIVISESSGVIDGLELKEPFTVNWPDAHGEVADLARPRYQAREIKLTCFMIASGPGDLMSKLNSLTAQLAQPGTQRLRLDPVDGKPLVYEVYSKAGYSVDKKWRSDKIIARFTLALIEPQPVKWVLSASAGQSASITLSAPSPITMYWGDGSKTVVMGNNQTINHTYGGTGAVYYAILSGELERMTVHSQSNLTEIWPRLY